MNSINLLPKDLREKNQQNSLKRTIYTITSIVLGGYVVIVAGIIGWWLFLSQQDAILAERVNDLKQQVRTFAQTEAVVRQVAYRSDLLRQSLTDRKKTSDHAKKFVSTQVALASWQFKENKHLITLNSSDPAAIESFTAGLNGTYSTIIIDRLNTFSAGVWAADVSLVP